MKTLIRQYPTGKSYIALFPASDWHSFPDFAHKLLGEINATDVVDISGPDVIDAHWYEFFWEKKQYRLIYEDWPHEISIESENSATDLVGLCAAINILFGQIQ